MKSTFLALLFLSLQCVIWVGENSLWRLVALNQRIVLQQEKNHLLLSDNLRLEREIIGLKQQPPQASSLVEDYIRWKLGLVSQGEWFFHW